MGKPTGGIRNPHAVIVIELTGNDATETKFLKWLGTDSFGKTGWEGEVTFL